MYVIEVWMRWFRYGPKGSCVIRCMINWPWPGETTGFVNDIVTWSGCLACGSVERSGRKESEFIALFSMIPRFSPIRAISALCACTLRVDGTWVFIARVFQTVTVFETILWVGGFEKASLSWRGFEANAELAGFQKKTPKKFRRNAISL